MLQQLDVGSAEEFDEINRQQGWDIEYRPLRGGDFRGSMQACVEPNSLVTREFVTGPVEVCFTHPENCVSLLIPVCPQGEVRFNNQLADGRRVFIVKPGADVRVIASADVACHVVRLPSTLIENCLPALGSSTLLLSRGMLAVELDRKAIHTIQLATDEMLARDWHVGGQTAQLGTCLLQHVLQVAVGQCSSGRDCSRDSNTLDQLLDFIDANLDASIGGLDLCRVANIHPRKLQRLFKKRLGLAPSQYILARRLNVVRRQLLAGDLHSGRITDIAYAHGFSHLGRFSGIYRDFFGELPSQTLTQSPSRFAKTSVGDNRWMR